jgi:hypothetical protein
MYIAVAKRFEDGWTEVSYNEDYIGRCDDEDFKKLLDEFTEIFNSTKEINGKEIYPECVELMITDEGYARSTIYPAAESNDDTSTIKLPDPTYESVLEARIEGHKREIERLTAERNRYI